MALAAVAACSQSPPPPAATAQALAPCTTPEPLRVNLQASQRLNPGEKGEALATVVRLYQLKGYGKLSGASFDDLLDKDKDTLGEDYLNVQEVTVNPADRAEPPLARHADAGYVAAVGLFRQPTGTTWRAIAKLPAADPQHCHPATDPQRAKTPRPEMVRFFLDENRVELR